MTKQEIEREMLELKREYKNKFFKLKQKLFELEQLEKEKQCHTMKKEVDFYIEIMKCLLKLNDSYCNKGNNEYSCSDCKFKTENGTCIKNWLLNEFEEFTRQAKKEMENE